MSQESSVNNKRIAKNTALLYLRTFFVMLISLYTSRETWVPVSEYLRDKI